MKEPSMKDAPETGQEPIADHPAIKPFKAGVSRDILNRIILILSIMTGFGLIATVFLFQKTTGSALMLLALLATLVTAKLLMRRGELRLAAVLTIAGVWLVFGVNIFLGGGVHHVSAVFFLVLTVIAGLLFGERATLWVVAISLITLFGLALLSFFGLLPSPYFVESPFGNLALLIFALLTTAGALNLALHERDDALGMAHGRLADQLKAQYALQESERKHRELVDFLPVAVFECDFKGNVLSGNLAIREIFGYSQADYEKGLNGFEMIHPDDRERAAQNLQTLLHGDKKDPFSEYTAVRKGGTAFPCAFFTSIILEEGKPVGFRGAIIDLSSQKQAREALRQAEEKYRTIIEQMVEGYFELDLAGNYTFANDAECKITGRSREELIGMNNRQYQDEENAKKAYQIFNRIYKTGQTVKSLEVEINKKDGTKGFNEISVSLKRDAEGKPIGFRGFTRDITERKRVEEIIRISEEKFSQAFHSSPILMAISTIEEGRFIDVNETVLRTLLLSREEVIGKTSFELGIFADPVQRQAIRKITEEKGPAKNIETQMVAKDGQIIEGLFSAEPTTIHNQKCWLTVMVDVTKQKRAEAEIQRANTLLNSIVENIPDMIFLKDAGELRFARFNRAGEELLGHSRDDLLGKNDYDFFPKEQADFFTQKDREVLRGKKIVDIQEEPLQTRNKGERILHTKKVPILNANGEPEYLMGISEDITDRRQMEAEKRRLEERLRRAEKMEALGQLAGGVAHDLNNVLGVLSGYSELLLAEIPEGQKSRRHVEKILQSTEKGAAIIQDLLTLARRGVLSEEVIQVNDIVSGFTKTPTFENIRDYHPGVTFRMECDPNLLNIKGSPVHLEKTLMNLVSNAAEAISGEGEVVIRTENRYLDKAIVGYDEVREGDYVVLSVSDTGTGISDEHREKIFEPFYTKKAMGRSGTGLGLTIVWGTVKDHNGYIDVQSRVGEGTTFTLYFPATREEQTAPPPRTPVERYMGRGETVLVVDDIAEQRDVASGLLKKLGYRVHSVSSGEEAIEYLKQNRSDILILDMIMAPGMDGMEAYRRILAMHPKQKAILVSGFSETDRVRKAQLLGAGVYVKKPYVMETIGLALRKELDRATV